jgi:hypothetical protein
MMAAIEPRRHASTAIADEPHLVQTGYALLQDNRNTSAAKVRLYAERSQQSDPDTVEYIVLLIPVEGPVVS